MPGSVCASPSPMDLRFSVKCPSDSEASDTRATQLLAQRQYRRGAEELGQLACAPGADPRLGLPLFLATRGQCSPLATQHRIAAGWQAQRTQPCREGSLASLGK